MAVGAYHPLGLTCGVERYSGSRFGMTGNAELLRRFGQQVGVVSAMGRMAFAAGADSSRPMQEIACGETFMTMGAEGFSRYDEAGVGVLVMAVVTPLFGVWRVRGFLLDTFFFQSCGQFILGCLDVIITTVLVRWRHAGNTVENGAGDLMHRQWVARAD